MNSNILTCHVAASAFTSSQMHSRHNTYNVFIYVHKVVSVLQPRWQTLLVAILPFRNDYASCYRCTIKQYNLVLAKCQVIPCKLKVIVSMAACPIACIMHRTNSPRTNELQKFNTPVTKTQSVMIHSQELTVQEQTTRLIHPHFSTCGIYATEQTFLTLYTIHILKNLYI